jgi:hypothetical protein
MSGLYNEKRDLLDKAVFGDQVKSFLNSEIGQYLLAKGDKERDVALSNLTMADPFNSQEIQKLQNEIKVIELIRLWLVEAIEEGEIATGTMYSEYDEGN